jgi:TolA-binding protein
MVNMIKPPVLLIVLSLSASCIKTASQVQREKRFENMSEQMTDSQTLVADMIAQMKDLQGQLDNMNGRIEEFEHKQRQIDPVALKAMNENLTVLSNQRQNDSDQLSQIQAELKEQRSFIEKVTSSLSTMNQKKGPKEELNEALQLVKYNKFSVARPKLLGLLEGKELTAGDQNKALHGLGRTEFYTKNYEKALVYFSKIFSKYPKSSLAPNSLLFIGKALQELGKKDEAKEAFAKLTEDYPNAREVKEAKKYL